MPGFFEKFIFELEAFSYIKMGLSLAKQLVSPQKMFSILIFGSPVCTPLIPCHHYWNGWRPWLQQHTETWRADSHAEYDEDKRGREETIFSIFRWNIVLHDPYNADEIVTEIEEWKQKVPGIRVKSCSKVLLRLLKTSHQFYLKETIAWILSLDIVSYWI